MKSWLDSEVTDLAGTTNINTESHQTPVIAVVVLVSGKLDSKQHYSKLQISKLGHTALERFWVWVGLAILPKHKHEFSS